MKIFDDVREFHERMGYYPYHDRDRFPGDLSTPVALQRRTVIREEHRELQDAISASLAGLGGGSKAAQVHEGIDVIYSVLGRFVELGMEPEQVAAAWDAVHAANMAKEAPSTPHDKPGKPEGWKAPDVIVALSENQTKGDREAKAWNADNVLGTRVRYWPGERRGMGVVSTTTSQAFAASRDHASIMVDGHASSIALSHVDVLP